MKIRQPFVVDVLFCLAALAGFCALFLPTFRELVQGWSNSEDYSHGFFVLPVSLYMAWQKKERLLRVPAHISWPGLLLLIGSLLVHVFSVYSGIKTVASLTLVSTIVGTLWFLAGWQRVRVLAFPLLFLLFMIPVPEQIYSTLTTPLQLFVSRLSVALTTLIDIPVLREGNVIYLPDKTFEVVRACSGIRSLLTLLCLSAIAAYLFLRSNGLKCLLLLSALPIAIVVNSIRVFVMIVVYRYAGLDLTADSVHTAYGLAIFLLSLFLINLVKEVLVRWDIQEG